jgi:ferredoxin
VGNVFIEIDADVCIGIGKCEELEPNAVDLGDDGVSRVREGIALPRERAEKIVKRCPSGAITIVDDAPDDAPVADPA